MIVTEEEAKKMWCPMTMGKEMPDWCSGKDCLAFTYRGERVAGNELRAEQDGPMTTVKSVSTYESLYSCGMAPGGRLEDMGDYE